MSKFLYGIDFGTTNSAISIFDEDKSEILETITIPTILYFPFAQKPNDKINYLVGYDAINGFIQDNMRGRFMKSIKRVLPRSSFIDTRIAGRRFNASDLVAMILKDLKTKADKIIDFDCQKVVIGRPVFFDSDDRSNDDLAQQRLKIACKNAGFIDIAFQFEPIAAAFTYEKNIFKKEKVLVADFGGGTTDFTFIELNPEKIGSKDRKNDIIATGGIYIGGDSFDSAFMWAKGTPYFGRGVLYESMPGNKLELPLSFFSNICSWEKMNFFNGWKLKSDLNKFYSLTKKNPKFKNLITLTENNLGYSLFQAIEKNKIELSQSELSTFYFSKMGIEINEYISIEQYNEIIERDLFKISNYLDDFLLKNRINPQDIDSLFLTGGTSLVSEIKNLFKSKFPHIPLNSGDNFISVVKGLAYSGYLFD